MPSRFIVPPGEILACANSSRTGANRAGAAEYAEPVAPARRGGGAGPVAEDSVVGEQAEEKVDEVDD
jgi:hypothetical protein